MRPASFDYLRPDSLEQAYGALADGGVALAGGQTLIPALKTRSRRAKCLVDLSGLGRLRNIVRSGEQLRLGAMLTHQELAASAEVADFAAALAGVAALIGDLQVRNQATLGGSLCLRHPTGDYGPVLLCLKAGARLGSSAGERLVSVEELLAAGPAPGELLLEVVLPHPGGAWNSQRFPESGWPLCCACSVSVGDSRSLAASGPVTGPVRLPDSEQAVIDAARGLNFPDTAEASADYRRHLFCLLAGRALRTS